jgi:carboxypeptidase C (cathepsin A)
MIGLLQEHGPCSVNRDSNSTTLNPWSWNQNVNMLYIGRLLRLSTALSFSDQPVQTGFSYDKLVNGTLNQLDSVPVPSPLPAGRVPKQNNTFLVGTFPSYDTDIATNASTNAAVAVWHFAQVFFQEFPDYKPNDNKISVWTESYGGRYGPTTAAFFQSQNEKIANGSTAAGDKYDIHLDTLGIINGCVDVVSMQQSYPNIAYNNTYGIQTISQGAYDSAVALFGQCVDSINQCRAMAAQLDPTNQGGNSRVDDACSSAANTWSAYLVP